MWTCHPASAALWASDHQIQGAATISVRSEPLALVGATMYGDPGGESVMMNVRSNDRWMSPALPLPAVQRRPRGQPARASSPRSAGSLSPSASPRRRRRRTLHKVAVHKDEQHGRRRQGELPGVHAARLQQVARRREALQELLYGAGPVAQHLQPLVWLARHRQSPSAGRRPRQHLHLLCMGSPRPSDAPNSRVLSLSTRRLRLLRM